MIKRAGTISILDLLGDPVLSAVYQYPREREEILVKWRQRIGPTFYKMQVCILPFEWTDMRTNEDGTNYDMKTQLSYRKPREGEIDLFLNGEYEGSYTSAFKAYSKMGCNWYTFQRLLSGDIKTFKGFTAQRVKPRPSVTRT